jgi:hypothetical protein
MLLSTALPIDGDTSTNDSFVVMATATGEHMPIDALGSAEGQALAQAMMLEVAHQLAQAIVRDGEGATKFITVQVEGGRDCSRMPPGGLRHCPFARWSKPLSLPATPIWGASWRLWVMLAFTIWTKT